MTLVRHTITAIERDQADATASGKQVVSGAVVTMRDSGGSTYQMADNAAGANASTSKTTNSNGQVTVYVEPGQYTVTVNGISSGITVGNGIEVTQSPTDATVGRLLKVGDFGIDSQVATELNGGLIEFGLNANGSFTRFPDGTMICSHTIATSSSDNATWTYPYLFSSIQSVQATANTGAEQSLSARVNSANNSSTQVSVFDSSNQRAFTGVNLTAIGRWK